MGRVTVAPVNSNSRPHDQLITPPGAILVATGVRKLYRTGAETVEALRDLDLSILRGEFLAVMGPSGSGKTTLLNCLSGLDDIDAGSVIVEGKDFGALVIDVVPDQMRRVIRAERLQAHEMTRFLGYAEVA